MRAEDAVVEEQAGRARSDRGELLQQFDGLEREMRGAIAPHRLELDEDPPIGPEAHAMPGERGAEAFDFRLRKVLK
jgi:hypothetical protein